jgi:phage antirepressor YoqD-like protein
MSTPRAPIKLIDYQCPECETVIQAPKQQTARNIRRSREGHIKTMWCHVCKKDTGHVQLSEYQNLMKPEVNMNEIVKVEFKNKRVLTTKQLADFYETDPAFLSNNFKRNIGHYRVGNDYFMLCGQEKTDFLNLHQIDDGSKNAQYFYLWTESGCLLHAKSLGSNKAWDVYRMLVDTYFRVKELAQPKPQTREEIIQAGYTALLSLVEEMKPKAEQYDHFISAGNNQSIGVIAKALNISTNGRKLGRNNLFAILRNKGILMSNNVPKQEYINAGYFEVKIKPIQMGDVYEDKPQTFVTPKGVSWLSKILKEG